jgi:hypothetical protein
VNTFVCPLCGQVQRLTGAEKIACTMCGGVIRLKGRAQPNAGKPGLAGRRRFGSRSDWIAVAIITLCVVISVVALIVGTMLSK